MKTDEGMIKTGFLMKSALPLEHKTDLLTRVVHPSILS